MDDLVSRLLEAIAETERLAESAGRDGEPNWTAGGDLSETVSTVKYGQPVAAGPYGYLVPEIRAHIVHNDPSSVLRRCAADRKTVERCAAILAVKGWEYDDTPDLAREMLADRAAAYGLEVTA